MTIQDEHVVTTRETQEPAGLGRRLTTVEASRTTAAPGGSEIVRRIVVVIFGLIQLVISLRIVLVAIDARTGNDIVSAILNISQVFVAPFEGILRSDALHAGGSQLDLAAVVALIGWTILEAIAIWIIGIFRRDSIAA